MSILENNFIRGVPSNLASQLFDAFCEFGAWGHTGAKTVAIGIAACPLLAGARAGAGALTCVPPIRCNLPFAGHSQAAVGGVLPTLCLSSRALPPMIRSLLASSRCAKMRSNSAIFRSALLRRDSEDAIVLSSIARSGADLRNACASTADSSSPNFRSNSATFFLVAWSVNQFFARVSA